jgi:hypothetical protein
MFSKIEKEKRKRRHKIMKMKTATSKALLQEKEKEFYGANLKESKIKYFCASTERAK